MELALAGISMPSASSTRATDVSACTPVQTPQIRSVECPGIARIAALQDDFEAAPHVAGGYRVADDVVFVEVDLDAQVPLDAADRIDDDALAAVVERKAVRRDVVLMFASSRFLPSAWLTTDAAACAATPIAAAPASTPPTLSALASTPPMTPKLVTAL